MQIEVSDQERESFGYALDLAFDDQSNYLQFGDTTLDYGKEWPEVAKQKAEQFRALAKLAEKLGLNGETERWTNLAENLESEVR